MFKNIASFCKYIYERITEKFNTIIDNKQLLAEDTHYCRMADGDFSVKPDITINQDKKENESTYKENRIKERMDIYKK